MKRRYYQRSISGLGDIVLETSRVTRKVNRFAYCAGDGRVFVSSDMTLLERMAACGSDAAATYLLETRSHNTDDVVLSEVRRTTTIAAPATATSAV